MNFFLFFPNGTFDCFKTSFHSATAELHQVWEQPSITVIHIDARNLWAHALNSEHAQSALCLFADAHRLEVGWLCLLLCMCTYTWGWAILRSGVLLRTLFQIWLRLNLPIFLLRVRIVYPDVDCLLYGPSPSSLGCWNCLVWNCAQFVEYAYRWERVASGVPCISSPRVLDVSPMYSSLQAISPHW